MAALARTAALCGDGFDIYSGNDDQTLPIMALGGKGVISVLANIMPRQTHDMCARFFAGDVAGSREIQLKAIPLCKALFCEVNPIPVKKAMNLMGLEAGPLRRPLTEMEEENAVKLEKAMTHFGVEPAGKVCMDVGASTGGTDIVAMILSKYTSMEIGRALLISDLAIAAWAGGLYGIATGLYCVLGTFAKAFMVDSFIESLNQRKVVTVISSHPEDVKNFILEKLHRSATVYTAEGAYTGQSEQVFTTVLTRRQAVLLRNHLRRVDPKAFLTIVNSSEIVGKGFRAL